MRWSSNIYSVVDDIEIKDSNARVKRTDKDDAQTGAHEIGHTLDLPDRGTSSSSVMNWGNTGSTSVTSWDVQDIMRFAERSAKKYPGNIKFTIHGTIPKGRVKTK